VRGRIKTLPGKQWGTGRAYNEIIKEIFDERGIEIPFPHMTLYAGEDKKGSAPPFRLARTRPTSAEEAPAPEASAEGPDAEPRSDAMPPVAETAENLSDLATEIPEESGKRSV
jgi:moderate conductance mechanosensitive channel